MTQEIETKLRKLKREKKYIALSLHPGIGERAIQPEGNRMFINEGREGKFEDVPESFYMRWFASTTQGVDAPFTFSRSLFIFT